MKSQRSLHSHHAFATNSKGNRSMIISNTSSRSRRGRSPLMDKEENDASLRVPEPKQQQQRVHKKHASHPRGMKNKLQIKAAELRMESELERDSASRSNSRLSNSHNSHNSHSSQKSSAHVRMSDNPQTSHRSTTPEVEL